MMLAPKLFLFFVPSSSINFESNSSCKPSSIPISSGNKFFSAVLITFETPLPLKSLPLSLFSMASLEPVEAPEGTNPNSFEASSETIKVAMVGVPLESRISNALIFLIFIFYEFLTASSTALTFCNRLSN